MSDSDSAEPEEEGINTLAAQVSRTARDRIVQIVQREKAKGATRPQIAAALAKTLADYDTHTRELLLKLGFGDTVLDDFPADNVVASRKIKDNTLELTLKQKPAGISLFTLVRHDQREWLVVLYQGLVYTLKLLK